MTDHDKPVPEPGEAQRGDEDVSYFEVDETNVSGTSEPPPPDEDDEP